MEMVSRLTEKVIGAPHAGVARQLSGVVNDFHIHVYKHVCLISHTDAIRNEASVRD